MQFLFTSELKPKKMSIMTKRIAQSVATGIWDMASGINDKHPIPGPGTTSNFCSIISTMDCSIPHGEMVIF